MSTTADPGFVGPLMPGQTAALAAVAVATTTTAVGTDPETPKDEDPEDLEIQCLVAPNTLDGYNIIWRIATENTGKQVIEGASKLLI